MTERCTDIHNEWTKSIIHSNTIVYQIKEEQVKKTAFLCELKTSNIYAATECQNMINLINFQALFYTASLALLDNNAKQMEEIRLNNKIQN